MDFEFSEEQEALRATVRRFLTEQAPIQPYVRDAHGRLLKGQAEALLAFLKFGGP